MEVCLLRVCAPLVKGKSVQIRCFLDWLNLCEGEVPVNGYTNSCSGKIGMLMKKSRGDFSLRPLEYQTSVPLAFSL
jgi:hypothetical protein